MAGEPTLRDWMVFDSERARLVERYAIARQFIGGPRSLAEQVWREGHIEDTSDPESPSNGE